MWASTPTSECAGACGFAENLHKICNCLLRDLSVSCADSSPSQGGAGGAAAPVQRMERPGPFGPGFCVFIYFFSSSQKRMRIVATSARVALDCGRRELLEPWMRPSPTAQRMALTAQLETLEASA